MSAIETRQPALVVSSFVPFGEGNIAKQRVGLYDASAQVAIIAGAMQTETGSDTAHLDIQATTGDTLNGFGSQLEPGSRIRLWSGAVIPFTQPEHPLTQEANKELVAGGRRLAVTLSSDQNSVAGVDFGPARPDQPAGLHVLFQA